MNASDLSLRIVSTLRFGRRVSPYLASKRAGPLGFRCAYSIRVMEHGLFSDGIIFLAVCCTVCCAQNKSETPTPAQVPEYLPVLDLPHLTKAAGGVEGSDDSIAHLGAGKSMLSAIELIGGFQQLPLFVVTDSTIALRLDLGLDLDAERTSKSDTSAFFGCGGWTGRVILRHLICSNRGGDEEPGSHGCRDRRRRDVCLQERGSRRPRHRSDAAGVDATCFSQRHGQRTFPSRSTD